MARCIILELFSETPMMKAFDLATVEIIRRLERGSMGSAQIEPRPLLRAAAAFRAEAGESCQDCRAQLRAREGIA